MPAPLPLITIAIPTFERVEFLAQALKSALSQDYPSFEILVHDDTQDNRVSDIVRSFSSDKINYRQNHPPLGLVPKLNDLLRVARGEWMVVLCDDDVFEPGYLSAIGTLAAAHPEASLLRTRLNIIDREGNVTRQDALGPTEMSPFQFASRILDIQHKLFTMNITGVAFRPKALEALGGFRHFHRGVHTDNLAWLMLGAAGPSFCDERALCSIRQYHGSITMAEDPDFEAAFETHLRMHQEVLTVLSQLEARAGTSDEKKWVKECRRVFKFYFSRLRASYDTAFERALLSGPLPLKKFQRVLSVMRRLGVPFDRRCAFYLGLIPVPMTLRKKILAAFLRYRQRRLRAYYERAGLGN